MRKQGILHFFAFVAIALVACNNLFAQENSCCPEDKCCKEAIVKDIDSYIQKVKDEWQLTGLAASFALDGDVIYSKAFGVKEKGGNEPIDVNTVFQIGSVSKSFTATVMASLVAEGKVKWEDTVANILPDFKMYDPWVTKNMQVKDIMTHRSGLRGQAGTYIPNVGYDRDDVYKMLGLLKPVYSFRGDYQYNNITFIIAEKIIEKVTGKSWEENVKERVFEPVGMTLSSMNGEDFKVQKNVAVPHEYFYRDSINVNALHGDDQALWWLTVVGPAGSVNSTVTDMIKYAEFHRTNGKVGGKQVMDSKAVAYLHKGHNITSQTGNKTTLYGNCWFIEQNNKYRLYFHTGTTWGFTALCFFVPEIELSGVILVNCEAGASPRYAIMRRLIDLVMGAPAGQFTEEFKDYSKESFEEWLADEKRSQAKAEEAAAKEEKIEAPKSKLLVGEYVKDELFGNAKISLEGDQLYIEIGKKGFKNKLNHKNGNTFTFWSDGHEFPLNFFMDDKGKKVTGFEVEFNYNEEDSFGGWTKK